MTVPRHQTGFAAVAAIFLVVVLAALGGFMLSFSNTQQLTSAQDLQGSRAYWAARGGLEWGVGKVVVTADPATITSATCATTLTIAGFSVNVVCTVQSFSDGGTIYIVKVTSVASAGTVGSLGYVERSVSASIER
ncbi:MAG: hypothetical protein K9K38_19340 [Rhodoferax sp.]|nr:hypothetical protein [Rhodoferax sp.]